MSHITENKIDFWKCSCPSKPPSTSKWRPDPESTSNSTYLTKFLRIFMASKIFVRHPTIYLQNLCKLPFLFYFLWPWISSGWPSFADFSKWEAVKQTNSDMMIGTWGKNLEEITTTTLHYSHHHFIEENKTLRHL